MIHFPSSVIDMSLKENLSRMKGDAPRAPCLKSPQVTAKVTDGYPTCSVKMSDSMKKDVGESLGNHSTRVTLPPCE